MDDTTFEQWSTTLLELRQARLDAIKLQHDERGKEYGAKDLFDHLMVSLDQIMTRWWEYERQSWDSNPPADTALAIETLRNELESIADFEIDAAQKDAENLQESIALQAGEMDKGKADLQAFINDLKKNYQTKIDSLANSVKKPTPTPTTPTPTHVSVPRSSQARSGGNGVAVFVMFLVGLGLGIGVAVFFRESGRQNIERLTEEKDKLSLEKREIISEYTALQETYFQLASGKLLTLPALEKAMKPLEDEATAKKKAAELDYNRTRETLLKKIPAGDRLDRAIEKLETEKETRLNEIENEKNARMEVYLKQKQIHEDLMNKK